MKNMDLIELLEESGIGMINGNFRAEDIASVRARYTAKNNYNVKFWVRLNMNNKFIGTYQLKVEKMFKGKLTGKISLNEEDSKLLNNNYPGAEIFVTLEYFNETSEERGTFKATSKQMGKPQN